MRESLVLPWILLCACIINATELVAISPGWGPPEVVEKVFIYDTDGHNGALPLVSNCNDPLDHGGTTRVLDIGGHHQVFFPPEVEVPYVDTCSLGVYASATFQMLGDPFYTRRWHPEFGCLSTFNYVGAQFFSDTPKFFLPISFSEYEIEQRSDSWEGNETENLVFFKVGEAFVVDDPTTFSLGIEAHSLFHEAAITVPCSFFVEYLPGNARSGSDYGSFPSQLAGTFNLIWSAPRPADDNTIQFGLPAPIGPVRISMSFDGYTTDTVELEVEDLKYYRWDPVLQSTGGPTPSGYEPRAGVLDMAVADALLGICVPCATLRGANDANKDQLTDAADFIVPDPQ